MRSTYQQKSGNSTKPLAQTTRQRHVLIRIAVAPIKTSSRGFGEKTVILYFCPKETFLISHYLLSREFLDEECLIIFGSKSQHISCTFHLKQKGEAKSRIWGIKYVLKAYSQATSPPTWPCPVHIAGEYTRTSISWGKLFGKHSTD